jgi:hypothetical protein
MVANALKLASKTAILPQILRRCALPRRPEFAEVTAILQSFSKVSKLALTNKNTPQPGFK